MPRQFVEERWSRDGRNGDLFIYFAETRRCDWLTVLVTLNFVAWGKKSHGWAMERSVVGGASERSHVFVVDGDKGS